jgi:hypothetical protein
MNTIIITTHLTEESKKIRGENISTVIGSYNYIEFEKETMKIVVITKNDGDKKEELLTKLKAIKEPYIYLYHQLDLNLDTKFNVSSTESENRPFYEKLLNANFGGNLEGDSALTKDSTTKLTKVEVFNEVWDYFKKKGHEISLEQSKLNFLHFIYNGGKPSNYEGDKLFAEKNLYEMFEDNPYQIDLDMDTDVSKGAEQRKYLIALRNVLLEE